MRFHAPSVSASADGDYYQLSLGPEDPGEERADPHEVRGPYLIVQRDFEMPCGERCYIESDDERYVGHFPLRLTEISPTRLAFEIVRKTGNRVEVSYALSSPEFAKLRRIAEIVFGLREPGPDDDDAP